MYFMIKELYSLLSREQKRRLIILQALVILMAFSEIVGVASIVPFMTLVGNPGVLQQSNFLADVYRFSGGLSPSEFIFWVGIAVLVALALAAMVSVYTVWRLSVFANQFGAELASRMYAYYLGQTWLFHAQGSSSQFVKNISMETGRVTAEIVQPLLMLNAKIVLAVFLSLAVFWVNPQVAFIGMLVFLLSYFLLYGLLRAKLESNGKAVTDVLALRFRLMNEALGGIKDVLLLGRQKNYIEQFEDSGEKYYKSISENVTLAHTPRYFMELIAFGAMVGLVLYLVRLHHGDLGEILPILSVYALAGMKLLPAYQQIYSNLATIKGGLSAYKAIRNDLIDSAGLQKTSLVSEKCTLTPEKSVKLEGIGFHYPNKKSFALNQLSLEVPANKVIGIVGASGSGKSTLIDIFLGLIQPEQGALLVDGRVIAEENMRCWQNSIGFVSQAIFLSEGSIAENIAFGLPMGQIDFDQVNHALKLANLDSFVDKLPEKSLTKVGERGVQLSGGQRQRIGIARALYHDASVLVFDEATSALDGLTEKVIMSAIHDFNGEKTIIMIAHRLKTVQKCDLIYVMNQGQIEAQGTFDELINSNSNFRAMAEHA